MLKAPEDSSRVTALLRVLGDSTRLRILALLEREELSVGELSRALGMAQSRVSNHLRVLREQPLLAERRAGPSSFLSLDLGGPDDPGAALPGRVWTALRADLANSLEHAADLERLKAVLAERRSRSAEFFDRVAGQWDAIGTDFATGQGRQRLIAHLLPAGLVVGDLGSGTGYLARALVGLAGRIVCVDRSEGMLEQARRQLEPLPAGVQLELRRGELDQLPIADGELDAALCGMVLHHLADRRPFLAEAHRVLRPGGTLCVLELFPHREEWLHEALGDLHLGLDPRGVLQELARAGFEDLHLETLDDRYRPRPPEDGAELARADLALYLVRARRPLAPAHPTTSNRP